MPRGERCVGVGQRFPLVRGALRRPNHGGFGAIGFISVALACLALLCFMCVCFMLVVVANHIFRRTPNIECLVLLRLQL